MLCEHIINSACNLNLSQKIVFVNVLHNKIAKKVGIVHVYVGNVHSIFSLPVIKCIRKITAMAEKGEFYYGNNEKTCYERP